MNESNMTKMSIMITRRWSYGSPEVERKLWQWWKKENKKLTWSWTQAEQDAATPHLATGTARISSLGNINVIIMVDMVIIRGKMAIIIIKYSSKDHIPGQYDDHQDCHRHVRERIIIINIMIKIINLAMTRSLRSDWSPSLPFLILLNCRPSTGLPNFKTWALYS